jgi:peptidyl-prolyl cis-trans isomerase C
LINSSVLQSAMANKAVPCRLFCGVLLLVATAGLAACHKGEGGGQSLARVDGEDITMLQVNEELANARIPPDQQKAAIKKVLEALIDRQVVVDEAKKEKIDRSPAVLRAIARAKAQIIEQAYLRKVLSNISNPGEAEISDYYHAHPEIFSKGKLYDMHSLLIARKDMTEEIQSEITSAKSLGDIEGWLKSHKVHYLRGIASRTTVSMPPAMATKLASMHVGQMFVVNDGGNSMIVAIQGIKDDPIAFEDAANGIARHLRAEKIQKAAETEITHLRSLAKIEYLKASLAPAADESKPASSTPAAPAITAPGPETKPAG